MTGGEESVARVMLSDKRSHTVAIVVGHLGHERACGEHAIAHVCAVEVRLELGQPGAACGG